MSLFEFGQFWSTNTFILYLALGAVVYFLVSQSVKRIYVPTTQQRLLLDIKKTYDINYILIFLLFLFIYAAKDLSFGADTEYYIKAFLSSTELNFDIEGWEPLFVLYNYLIRGVTSNYVIYFFITGLIVAYGYTRFIKTFWTKRCDSLFLILVLVDFSYYMNIMRSGIGISIMLLSFCALKQRKNCKAIVLSVIAMLFQYTFVVNFGFFIIYFILRTKKIAKIKIKILFFIFCLLLVACVLLKRVLLDTRYAHYVTESTPNILGYWAPILSGLLALIELVKYNRKSLNEDSDLAISGSVFTLLLLAPAMLLGAYRFINYYFMPRLLIWGFVSKQRFGKVIQNVLLRKLLIVIAILFYALFVLSRRSVDMGFAYIFNI